MYWIQNPQAMQKQSIIRCTIHSSKGIVGREQQYQSKAAHGRKQAAYSRKQAAHSRKQAAHRMRASNQ
jgi:hypothetical protein